MIQFLAKSGATIDENALLKVLEIRSDDGEKVRAIKGLVNHGPPVDLNSLVAESDRKTAMEALYGNLGGKGSVRLVKFLIKKGARVSWTKLCRIGCSFRGGEENAMMELLRACVDEDKRLSETLREDSAGNSKGRVEALAATILCSLRNQYWKLFKMVLRQEGVDLNLETPLPHMPKEMNQNPLSVAISNLAWYNTLPPTQSMNTNLKSHVIYI